MEENFNQSPVLIPRDDIRSIQYDIKAQLENYNVEISELSLLETSNFCDCVRDQILNYADEPHLNKSQNNCRRIFIASELFVSICSIYRDIVDYEFSKSVFDMVQWEKYKKLSREITQQVQLESKAEKFFAKEALNKLKEAEIRKSEAERQDSQQNGDLETAVDDIRTPPMDQQLTVDKRIPENEINETLEEALSCMFGNLTELRDEPVTEFSRQQHLISNISRQDVPIPETSAETSIQECRIEANVDESLREILGILESEIPQTDMAGIEQPTSLLDFSDKPGVEERPPENAIPPDSLQGSEKWSLPSLESDETTRKRRRRLIIDAETTIHHYAERAIRQNRNIDIKRVEVFEGPPYILQAFSVNHAMTTPAFKISSVFRNIGSSKLRTLYNRHLSTERKAVEPVLERRKLGEQRNETLRRSEEIAEEMRRVGMHPAVERSDLLAEIPAKRSRVEDLELPTAAIPPNESAIGMPVSRLINSTIQPLEAADLERINNVPISPRVQRLQGQSVTPKTTPPWFLSTTENCPSAKYREFKYVFENIQKYWLFFEDERMEKYITLREFLSLESDESLANFLTVLRIVDKMSIQRKLKLEYKDGDVFIRPFESPDFSTTQLTLQRPKVI